MGIGKTIKELLVSQGRSVTWLSRQTGININTLYVIIKRDSNYIDLVSIRKIEQALCLKPYTLVLCGAKAVRHEYYRRIGLLDALEQKER